MHPLAGGQRVGVVPVAAGHGYDVRVTFDREIIERTGNAAALDPEVRAAVMRCAYNTPVIHARWSRCTRE